MEPFASTAFDGPQHNDILATNRGYGDMNEHNDITGNSTTLGAFRGSKSENGRSIDGSGDEDFFSFAANAQDIIEVTLSPVGSTYLAGPQNPDGTCSAGTFFNSLNQNDMGLEILDTDEISTFAMSTSNAAGVVESVSNQLSDGGTYFVRVIPGFEDSPQLYDLVVTLTGGPCSEDYLDLTSRVINYTTSFSRCTILAGDGFEIAARGDVTFTAGRTAVLRDGFSVDGRFKIVLDANLIQ